MPSVICNTSPLQYLYQIKLLSLLPELFGHEQILIPQAVVNEINTGRRKNKNLPTLTELSWVVICPPVNSSLLLKYPARLGNGEKHVLALGLDTPDALLVMDDRIARRYAFDAGLDVTGTLGILLLAKQQGLLTSVKPSLDHLLNSGFHISANIYLKALELAGEKAHSNSQQ